MEGNATVTRHSFFRRYGEPSIDFVEKHPPGDELGHVHGCNCTRHTTERPDGTPDQVTESLSFRLVPTNSRRRSEEILVSFASNEMSISFRWGHKAIDRPDRPRFAIDPSASSGDFEEASFRFSTKEPSIDVGIWTSIDDSTLPESVEAMETYAARYLSMRLYRGRDIDVSRFMNGHVPSRVLRFGRNGEDVGLLDRETHPATEEALANGARILEDDVWIHHLSYDYGGESFRILDAEEAYFWRNIIARMVDAQCAWTASSSVDVSVVDVPAVDVSVAEVAQRACQSTIPKTVEWVSGMLSMFLDRIEDTALFRLAQAAREEADRNGRESREAVERERAAFRSAHPKLQEVSVADGEDPILEPLRKFFAEQGKVLIEVTHPSSGSPQDT